MFFWFNGWKCCVEFCFICPYFEKPDEFSLGLIVFLKEEFLFVNTLIFFSLFCSFCILSKLILSLLISYVSFKVAIVTWELGYFFRGVFEVDNFLVPYFEFLFVFDAEFFFFSKLKFNAVFDDYFLFCTLS